MAVTEVMHDPNRTPIPEGQERRVLARGGPCLVCGEWIEADDENVYRVQVSNPPREAEYPLHEACFERAKHPSIASPT
jgi:hypothetical protein